MPARTSETGATPPATTSRRVVAVVPDLLFATRIGETAARLGIVLEQCGPAQALARVRRERPDLVILDLHAPGDPVSLARTLKSDPETRSVPLVGFYAHVDRTVRDAALAAGVDQVLARSAFSARLPNLLAGAGGQGEGGTRT